MRIVRPLLALIASLGTGFAPLRAEFLFDTPTEPSEWIWADGFTAVGFRAPTLSLHDWQYEYSAWDIFYAPKGAGNYPDVFAPAGGEPDPEDPSKWRPVQRSTAGFAANPNYNPEDPYAFWHPYNPTITQVKSNTTFIIGPDSTGNIYTFQDKTGYQLHQATEWAPGESLQTVIFQFQTDGTNVDFANIRLGYKAEDGNTYYLGINDRETEYLREYSTTGSDHWSATAGYRNRVMLQWDLSGVTGTGEFWIEWESQSSSMSFQKADLLTASYYEVGMPVSSTWIGSEGEWSDSANWQGQAGGTPLENGNLKFKNASAAQVDIDDGDHLIGEIIFDNAADVTIRPANEFKLIANTGITTRSGLADTIYTFDADYELGALNFFEINTGKVVMNGVISGDYGMVKLGAGTLELNGENTFTKFLAVQAGTLVLNGSNAYTGTTNVVNGRVIVTNDAAFGSGTSALNIGGDADLYAFTTGVWSWLAELILEGDIEIDRNISLGAGDLGKRLGASGTVNGAEFSGNISFSGVVANPDAPGGASAVGNTRLTAETASDTLIFSGQMTGGNNAKTVTVDGAGTIVYSGVNKTYDTSTQVHSGTLLIASETAYTGAGHWTVGNGAKLVVDGSLAGSGNLTLQNGAVLAGAGQIHRNFTVGNGAILAPGNSPGSLMVEGNVTWASGGIYQWEINDVDADDGWDLLEITGSLTLTASAATPFVIEITSLSLSNIAGAVHDFAALGSYSWVIATASGGIIGFSRDKFFLDFSRFDYSPEPGYQFDLIQNGNQLVLTYGVIPEPSAWMLATLGMLLLLSRRNTRRRSLWSGRT